LGCRLQRVFFLFCRQENIKQKQIGLWGREIDCLFVPLTKRQSIRVVVLASDKVRQII
jgi:hypothetical protein